MFHEIVLPLPRENFLSRQWNEFLADCARREPASLRRQVWFVLAWVFIGAVSVYDAWLVKLYQVCILEVELNPIAWCIIRTTQGIGAFLVAKAVGTLIVLAVLAALHRHVPRLAYPVINVVSAFQMALLLFLRLA